MRTTFYVISIDKFSSYLTVNTVFILKSYRSILLTVIMVIYGDHHATQIQSMCKNTVISVLYSCRWHVWWTPLITRTVDVTENVACLFKQGTVYLSHCRDQATCLTTNDRQISRRSHRNFQFFAAFRLNLGPLCVSYRGLVCRDKSAEAWR
jgi:hypothetical protein